METSQGIQDISCRICRESACCKKDTFDLDSVWSSLFEFCMGIQITQNGPLSFCESCSNKLRDYGDFKSLCLQSEEIWKSVSNYYPVQDHKVNNLNIAQEEKIEENDGYPDTFDHDDCDYNVILVVKEENDENLVKKLEDKLTEISIKKIEKPLVKFEESTEKALVKFEEPTETPLVKFEEPTEKSLVKFEEPTDQPRSERKTRTKIGKITKRCKFGEKRDIKLKAKSNQKPKPSENNSNVSVKLEVTDLYCGLCHFTSSSSVKLKKHLIEHCQGNILSCQLCRFEGKDVAHMIAHRYTHCPQKTKKLECPMCSKVFLAGRRLQFHYRTVHLETKGGLCVICGRIFGSYKIWLGHEKGHFTKNFICDHCGMSFYYRNHVEEHMSTHYDIFNYICDLCGRAFKKSSNLKSHYFNHHREHKKVTCTICSSEFKHEKYLTKHMREQHGEKKYFCEVCSKGFCTNQILREHTYYYHSDERPYACDLCGARYRANLALKIHQRIHTGELPYTCPECGKGFRSSSTCKVHQRVHTGVRPHKCLHCDKTFNSKKLTQAHCNSKHKDVLKKGEIKL